MPLFVGKILFRKPKAKQKTGEEKDAEKDVKKIRGNDDDKKRKGKEKSKPTLSFNYDDEEESD